LVPSESILRDVLIRVDPEELDQALQCWNARYGAVDESLVIDSKTMCNAIDEAGRPTHIMSAIGHRSKQCYTQKSGRGKRELAYGITSKTPALASAAQVLRDNCANWSIENSCHYIIDWNFDEDRSRIRTGHGLENMTRFAVGIIKSKGVKSVAQEMRRLTLNTRLVFDYLKMTRNTCRVSVS